MRGSALILVVAVLGILFVAGVALLTRVTFATKTLDHERVVRENDAAVSAVEDMVLGVLGKAFIGEGSHPLNAPNGFVEYRVVNSNGMSIVKNCVQDKPCVLTYPAYSEVPGVQPWLDVTEPVMDDIAGTTTSATDSPDYKLYSKFGFALTNRPGVDPNAGFSSNVAVKVNNWNNPGDIEGDGSRELARDADGDGIADTYEFAIPRSMIATDLRRSLSDRLRDVAVLQTSPSRDPDVLWLTIKVVPHGAMANLNDSHDRIRENAMDLVTGQFTNLGALLTGAPYLPQSEEWLLRHRGPMLPRTLPLTRLVADLPDVLGEPQWLDPNSTPDETTITDSSQRHWWLYDFATDAEMPGSRWRVMMDPYSPIGEYDVSHNLTTISYDDNLIRGGVVDMGTAGVVDVIDWMRLHDANSDGRLKYPSRQPPAIYEENPPLDANGNPIIPFAWDNYPFDLDGTGDPRLGRLKLSLPTIDEWLADQSPPVRLQNLAAAPAVRNRVVRTMQDAFLLMLRNQRDFNRDGMENDAGDVRERAIAASMLTANLIDYADKDANGEPIRVPVIDEVGMPVPGADGTTPLAVYGFEQQPFITAVYAKVKKVAAGDDWDATSSGFAVELYNPYSRPIILNGYILDDIVERNQPRVLYDGAMPVNATGINDEILDGEAIAANSYLTVYSFTDPNVLGGDKVEFGAKWFVTPASQIVLKRRVIIDRAEQQVVVDRFNVRDDVKAAGFPEPVDFFDGDPPVEERMWERDSTEWAPGQSKWRFIVPLVKEWRFAGHSLGVPSRYDNPKIYPVHADVANRIRFGDAFPTTGSMLLMMGAAHLVDASPNAATLTSPFNRINKMALTMPNIQEGYARIDNGRMPVFDLSATPAYRSVAGYGTPGAVQGVEALPWGQLVFDYFTAMPYKPCDPADYTCNVDDYPKYDQGGLRVSGRININAAPWRVLQGVPMIKPGDLNGPFDAEIAAALGIGTGTEQTVGKKLAQAIVGYREARDLVGSLGDYHTARDPRGNSSDAQYAPRQGYGYLTVGELLNVCESSVGDDEYRMDDGALIAGAPDPGSTTGGRLASNADASYVRAVARMALLRDWLTTRSQVFTIYGVIRGQYIEGDTTMLENSLRRTDEKAIRFQTTVDRLPMFFGKSRPERIGSRIMGGYSDVRSE